jgi:hypothetical protein
MKLAVGTEKEFFSTLHGIAYLAKQVDRESALPLSPTVTFAFSIKDDDDENATHEFQECPEDLRAIFEAVLQAFGPRMLDYEYAEIRAERIGRYFQSARARLDIKRYLQGMFVRYGIDVDLINETFPPAVP